jgi:hypothetical protein
MDAVTRKGDLTVPLTPELEPFRDDLEYFMRTMVRKLHVNRHKGFSEKMSVIDLLTATEQEYFELRAAVKEESQFETALEAVDVANMAFLVALKVWQMTKSEYKEMQNGCT